MFDERPGRTRRQTRRVDMKVIAKLGIGVAAGVLTIGAGATAFAAGSGTGDGTPTGSRATFVCAHLDEIEAQQQTRLDLLNGRLHLLQEADDAAKAAGKDKAAARIETRIGTTNERITKVTDRQTKLSEWAASHCTAAPTPG
jgi:hypothetical protein